MLDFSLGSRRRDLERAAGDVIDLIVVGAGITGAGVAREAALAGYSVLLVDKQDFASGTSSRSSKLIHGGLRYLAQGDVALVKEAARERGVLRRIAPHLTRPTRMLIPVGSRRARLKMAAGLWTFDRLAGDANPEPHAVLDRDDVLALEGALRSDRVAGGVAYTEFITDDARLTLTTARSAARAGALVANYAEVSRIEPDRDGLRAVIEDRIGGGRLVVRARCLVNAAGPWFDRVRGLCEDAAAPLLQLTRGIHLVFRRERLPVGGSVVLRAPDGRSTFVVPRGRYVYAGTTDTMYQGAPEEPGVSVDDACYLLECVGATFADAPTAADVVGTWAGVRPLLRQDGKSPSEISRRDEVRVGPGPVVAIAGGKLTTYRRMAERVLESVTEQIGRAPTQNGGSAHVPLIGGSADEQGRARTEAARLADTALEERLWSTYGVEARSLMERGVRSPDVAERVGNLDELTVAEVDFAVRSEMVTSLDDLLRRRTSLGLFDIDAAVAAAPAATKLLGDRLGWSPERAREEAERFSEHRVGELATVRSVAAKGAA
jgi:glycerol-3-phosphate dehydrogenase